MKAFCFIFYLYILFLSFQPCEELTAQSGLRASEPSAQKQLRAAAETGEKGDHCSPFCICSCCHFSTAYQFRNFTITSKLTTSAILSPKFFYQNPSSKAFKNSIWQPPKFNFIG